VEVCSADYHLFILYIWSNVFGIPCHSTNTTSRNIL
jgi:hypothetical protein